MYNNYRFERNARRRRTKAMLLTILFHTLLIGGIAWYGGADIEKLVPETVKEWLGMEIEKEAPATDITEPLP